MLHTDEQAQAVRSALGVVVRGKAVLLIVSGLAATPLTWIIGGLLARIGRKGDVELSSIAMLCVDWQAPLSLLGLAAAGCGVAALLLPRGRWLWLITGILALIGLVAVILLGLVGTLAPLYQYQDLG